MAEEKAMLEQKLQEAERRSDAKLRAERARLAVRYSNAPKPSSARRGDQSPKPTPSHSSEHSSRDSYDA